MWGAVRDRHWRTGRVHIRRDSDGLWFWYHPTCRTAEAQIDTFDAARVAALAHADEERCPQPAKPFASHIEVDCDRNRLRASWLCPDCKQYCASHNPCDCCFDDT
jgi:hypothetical protein